ncbi:MAG TPA: hypothetical protein PKL59_22070, partial [Nitrospira sp.]|nr:hypothetical protein [Nitrospira sp.]
MDDGQQGASSDHPVLRNEHLRRLRAEPCAGPCRTAQRCLNPWFIQEFCATTGMLEALLLMAVSNRGNLAQKSAGQHGCKRG